MAGTTKLRVAAALASAALRGDGVLTLVAGSARGGHAACANRRLGARWWTDPVAALIIAIGLAAESLRVAIRHRFG